MERKINKKLSEQFLEKSGCLGLYLTQSARWLFKGSGSNFSHCAA
jgi:hypothetical protein